MKPVMVLLSMPAYLAILASIVSRVYCSPIILYIAPVKLAQPHSQDQGGGGGEKV